MPLIVIWLNNRPKNSKLVIRDISVISQDTAQDENEKNFRRLLDVGRIVIRNEGKFIAKSVEAYIEEIIFDGEIRKDFIQMPLVWTHGQLGKQGPLFRDIYPNQTVYLDIFNHIFDPDYVGGSSVLFAVAAGLEVDNLSKMNLGESEILIKFYQESGQVDQVWIKARWDGNSVPQINIFEK